MKPHTLIVFAACASLTASRASAQQTPATAPAPTDYVTREEHEKLRSELDSLRREMAATKQTTVTQEEVDQTIEEIEKDLKSVRADAGALRPGSSKFLITGYTFAGFGDSPGENSSFNAGFVPIFLWKIGDRVFVEAEPEFELEGEGFEGETEIGLEYANISFILNDYMTLRGGLFLTPFGQFPERLHAAWINKLPTFPLVYQEEGGLVPFSSLGVELRGAFPVRSSSFNYAVYLSNGPSLVTGDEEEVGQLAGGNFEDENNNKAVGGRIGFLPIRELEIGYSIQAARVGAGDVGDLSALLQAVDVGYRRDLDALRGSIDLRAEWVWSNVDDAVYDPDAALGFGPLAFSSNRTGGYLQAAYRPSKVDNELLQKTEFVCRYDILNDPGGVPWANDQQQLTLGVNYWVGPSTVIKTAVQFSDQDTGEDGTGFFIQGAVGF